MAANAVDEVMEMLKTSTGQQQFLDWSASPVTLAMLRAARQLARPKPLGVPNANASETALASLYHSLGGNAIVDFLHAPVSTHKARAQMPQPTYGAGGILEDQGYIVEEEGPKNEEGGR